MKYYDPKEHSIIFGGPMSGFADDQMIEIEWDEDAFEDIVGVDGETTRSDNGNNNATAKIKLMQSSNSNDVLSALYNLDKLTPGGAGVVPFTIKDGQGTTLIVAGSAYVKKLPTVTRGKKAGPQEWTIRLVNPKVFIGGN